MTRKVNIADSALASRRTANATESGELLRHAEEPRDRRVQRSAEKREGDGRDPCRQLSGERPTELARLSQVVRSEFFAGRNYTAAPDVLGELDCEESPTTTAVEESLQNCCIVPEIRKERHTHELQVHCRLASRRQCTN